MERKQTVLVGVLACGLLAGCTHQRIETYKPSDTRLTCPQIQQEIAKTENAIAEIDRKTGLSWRNAGLALVSGVGLIMNEVNGSKERASGVARIEHLKKTASDLGCNR